MYREASDLKFGIGFDPGKVSFSARAVILTRADFDAGKYIMLPVRALQMKLSPAGIENQATADP
jgi:hypothetical protein